MATAALEKFSTELKKNVDGWMDGAVKGEIIPSDVLSASEPLCILLVLMDCGSFAPSGASFRTTEFIAAQPCQKSH